jgi:hypothetical protein
MEGTVGQRRGDNSGCCHQNVNRLRPLERGASRTTASDLSATSPTHFPGKVVVNDPVFTADQRSIRRVISAVALLGDLVLKMNPAGR